MWANRRVPCRRCSIRLQNFLRKTVQTALTAALALIEPAILIVMGSWWWYF